MAINKIGTNRQNTACEFFPCHKNLEDCTFCYCPFYACGNKKRGKYLTVYGVHGEEKLTWDCSKCTWIHKKKVVDQIFAEVRKIHDKFDKI